MSGTSSVAKTIIDVKKGKIKLELDCRSNGGQCEVMEGFEKNCKRWLLNVSEEAEKKST